MPSLDSWAENSGELDSVEEAVSMEMLKQAIRRAENDVQRRFQTEFMLWTHSKFCFYF